MPFASSSRQMATGQGPPFNRSGQEPAKMRNIPSCSTGTLFASLVFTVAKLSSALASRLHVTALNRAPMFMTRPTGLPPHRRGCFNAPGASRRSAAPSCKDRVSTIADPVVAEIKDGVDMAARTRKLEPGGPVGRPWVLTILLVVSTGPLRRAEWGGGRRRLGTPSSAIAAKGPRGGLFLFSVASRFRRGSVLLR
jgi:hypothetical protein